MPIPPTARLSMHAASAAVFFGIASAFSPTLPAATSENDAILAAMNVGRKQSYAWNRVVQYKYADSQQVISFQGKTEVGGLSQVSVQAANGSAIVRLAPDVISRRVDTVFFGNDRGVVSTDNGWVRLEDLPDPFARQRALASIGRQDPNLPSPYDRRGRSGRAETPMPGQNETLVPILKMRLPHEDLQTIIASSPVLRVTADGFEGELSMLGAQDVLDTFGRTPVTVRRISASYKCTIQNRLVTRMEMTLDVVAIGNQGTEVPFTQTITTVIQSIDSAPVNVPDQVRTLLGAGPAPRARR